MPTHDLGLRDYLQILRRRKWIVLQALVIVPLAAVAFALRQSPLYQASADVLLRSQSLSSTLSGIASPSSTYSDPTQASATQLQIAELPLLARRVASALPRQHVTAAEVQSSTQVSSIANTDFLRFTATAPTPALAELLATEYAHQFTVYRQQLDTGSITKAIRGLQRRIDQLGGQHTASARDQAAQLQTKVEQLQTLLSLQTANAVLVRPAAGAAKIRPRPTRYGALGLMLGLVLGVGLAFLRDALDTRLRSDEQIGAVLGLPLLARIPAPSRQLQRDRRLVMVADPTSSGAEAYRRLRMNLEFATVGKPSQVIMVTSALGEEGKSTTLANLAVAMALGGKRVALVDLDLRRPAIGPLFRLGERQPGLSAVVLGYADLDEALVAVPLGSLSRGAGDLLDRLRPGAAVPYPVVGNGGNGNGSRNGAVHGSLSLLPTGIVPPDPGQFVGIEGVSRTIAALRERVDVVLLDTPPLLAVGDGLTAARHADALVVVAHARTAKRAVTAELARVLAGLPAARLGFVLCGVDDFGGRGYAGYGYGYERRRVPATRQAGEEALV